MSERDFRIYCEDILESGSAIFEYVKDLSYEEFQRDRKTYSAVIREFEIIGEAVGKLPEELKKRRPQVEWQDIKDFRNLLIHEYFGVDLEIVWKIIEDDLPGLLDAVNCLQHIEIEIPEA
ncbi:putative toxin-antitoxin system, antitoxin component [delta proteobacterium NaphS2]|nr:putative toxin-antitoxin system, antitoxin component [delta proteobacterium NaphS2]